VQGTTGIVVPNEDTLATMNCNLMEGIWMEQTEFKVPVTNWGNHAFVAHIEEAAVVNDNDDAWQSVDNPSNIKHCRDHAVVITSVARNSARA